jgi:membrane protease YdiL (CAAX protease family)
VVAFGPVLLGEILAAALVPLLLIGVPERTGTEQARGVRRLNLALRALALVPLIRVIGVAIEHPDVRSAVSILVLGVLGCWLALRTAPALELPRSSLVAYPVRPVPLLLGCVLSLAVYLAGAPVLASSGSGGVDVAVAVVALVFAAAAEEFLFRGVLQSALQRAAARPGVLLGACLFGATYLGFRSLPLALVMLLAGLLFSDVVLRTGATGAVVVAHAILAVGASVVWPYVLGREHPEPMGEPALVAVLAVAIAAALWRLLRGRGASLSLRRGAPTRAVAPGHSRSEDLVTDL